jgi:pimeloyl-ACP methyl ester carboxylesterase
VLKGLEAVLQQGPQDPAIIVGNSLGAWAALLYARQHPDRVARLVLVNGGALVGDRPDLSLTPKTREEAAALMTNCAEGLSRPGFVLDNVVGRRNRPIARLVQTAGEMGQYSGGQASEVTAR